MIWIRNSGSRFGFAVRCSGSRFGFAVHSSGSRFGLFVFSWSTAASLGWLFLLEQVGDFFVLNVFVVIHRGRLHYIELAVRSLDDRELLVLRRNGIHCVRTAAFNRLVREKTVSDQACQCDL